MVLKIQKSLPQGTVIPPAVSASAHVLRSKLNRIYPQSQLTYTFASNNQIVFDINSPTDFWDALQSYIRMKVTVALNVNSANDTSKYLAEGGAQALFSRLEIFTKSGVLIERLDDVNRLYSIFSTASHSPDYVENNLKACGDSCEGTTLETKNNAVGRLITFTQTGSQYDAGTGILTLPDGNAIFEIEEGDILEITDKSANISNITAVKTVNNNGQVTMDFVGTSSIALNQVDIVRVIASPARLVDSERKHAANTASYTMTFQPFSPFLMNGNLIPLFLMRGGLRIVLTMDRPEFSIVSQKTDIGTGYSGANITISDPEYLCHFLTPDQALSDLYLQLYTQGRIQYFFTGYKRFQSVVSGAISSSTLSHQTNVRSAKHVVARIQNERARTVTGGTINGSKSTYTADSIAMGLGAGLGRYQVGSGSELFPESTPMVITADKNEPHVELQRVMGSLGAPSSVFRCRPHEWREQDGIYKPHETGRRTDSSRLVMSALLSRDPTPFSGLDLSLNQLTELYDFTALHQLFDDDGLNTETKDRYITTFVGHDSSVSISDAGVIVYS